MSGTLFFDRLFCPVVPEYANENVQPSLSAGWINWLCLILAIRRSLSGITIVLAVESDGVLLPKSTTFVSTFNSIVSFSSTSLLCVWLCKDETVEATILLSFIIALESLFIDSVTEVCPSNVLPADDMASSWMLRRNNELYMTSVVRISIEVTPISALYWEIILRSITFAWYNCEADVKWDMPSNSAISLWDNPCRTFSLNTVLYPSGNLCIIDSSCGHDKSVS